SFRTRGARSGTQGIIDLRVCPWVPGSRCPGMTEQVESRNFERVPELRRGAGADDVAHAKRDSALAGGGIRAEGLVEHREHGGEVDAGAVGFADVVPAMHHW